MEANFESKEWRTRLSLSGVGSVDRDGEEDAGIRVHAGLDKVAVVAKFIGVRLAVEAKALVGLSAGLRVLVRAHPVRAAVLTGIALPAGLAEAVVLEQKETTVVYRVQCGPLILWDDFWRIGYC